MEPRLDLNHVVRRVIAARVRDSHLVEDLSQETLVRVAAAQPRLAPDALQAYAIVTARNVIISHARTESVHDRHSHRLVDYTTLEGPEELALEREETNALATALQQLDEADRDWLLRHEAEGISTDTLAGEAGISSGAAAMRLARARATLRVEFVVAFRRVQLPTARCRPVLLSLSAGDRRRQGLLDAAGHLVRCPTCAQLARPVTERRRGIAAWLIVPAAEAVRRAFASLRRNRSTQIAVLGATTVAAVGIVILTLPEDDGAEQALAPAARATAPQNATA
ncbi:MAG: sigma-70 family RNA polymerase sigma factor, partial [Acidimicrobiia bacterium]|nr:sigma-70 family RNA polymerase sigma factor [Acidimicrobiia bacterium]